MFLQSYLNTIFFLCIVSYQKGEYIILKRKIASSGKDLIVVLHLLSQHGCALLSIAPGERKPGNIFPGIDYFPF